VTDLTSPSAYDIRTRPARHLMWMIVVLLLAGACSHDVTEMQPATDSRFHPGEVWHYHTRPGEEGSLAVVGAVDQVQEVGRIVHVRVEGVSVRSKTGEVSNVITHLPMRESAFAASVTTLANAPANLDGFEADYDKWLDGYESGSVRAIGEPLNEVLTMIERSLAR